MLEVEIVRGHETVLVRQGKNGVSYYQRAYAHIGGAFPHEFRLPLSSPQAAYAVGKYYLSPSSYRVNQWSDLEINRFELTLVPVQQVAPVKAANG